jgi:hypothetical protein
MAYTKLDLLNDINTLVERYVEQELALRLPVEAEAEADITVELDSDGHYIDKATGDIWDLGLY